MTTPARILLLGASGQVGTAIRHRLRHHYPETALVCSSRNSPPANAQTGETWLQFDPFQDDWSGPGRADLLINAIGAIRGTRDMPFARVHSGLTQLILAHRTQMGDPRIIQVSALGARPDHEVAFLRTKAEADAMLMAETGTVIVRPSIVCTPATMLQRKLKKLVEIGRFALGKLLVPRGFLASKVQPILPDDLGDLVAAIAADRSVPGIVEAVGPEKMSFGELLQLTADAMQKKVRPVEVSKEIVDGFVRYFLSVWFPGTLNYEQFRLLFEDNVGDGAMLQKLLGRSPSSTRPFWKEI